MTTPIETARNLIAQNIVPGGPRSITVERVRNTHDAVLDAAQFVETNLEAHVAASDPHPQYTTPADVSSALSDFAIASSRFYSFDAVASGQQLFNLPQAPSVVLGCYINGIRQRSGSYTVTGSQVSIPDSLLVVTGDVVEIEFRLI